MKKVFFALAVAVTLTSCNAQENKEDGNSIQNNLENPIATNNEPRGTWKVNKEVDENGNLIRYDSIYSYSYGNINGKEIPPQKLDSVMASFNQYMTQRMPNSFPGNFLDPFENDSLEGNFFEKGFFESHWKHYFPEMQKQLKQMDSLHQQFFQDSERGLFPLEDKSKTTEKKM